MKFLIFGIVMTVVMEYFLLTTPLSPLTLFFGAAFICALGCIALGVNDLKKPKN